MAVNDTDPFWTSWGSDGAVLKAPTSGGTPIVLAAGQPGQCDVAVDGTNAYFANQLGNANGSVEAVALGGGALVDLATMQAAPTGIACDASGVYWVNYGASSSPGAVLRATPGKGGARTVLVKDAAEANAIAVGDTAVFWADLNGSIAKVAK